MYTRSLHRAQVILRSLPTQRLVHTKTPVTISRKADVMFSSAAAHANPGPANGWNEGPSQEEEGPANAWYEGREKEKHKHKEKTIDIGTVETPKVEGHWTVEKVLATLPSGAPAEGSSSPVPYFHLLEKLKTTKREGWRRFGINRGESISDHMYRMSLMSMLAPPSLASRLDLAKCMKMCLIHDMAESLVGDITPVDGVAKPEKSRREASTMDYITKSLLGNVYGGQIGDDIKAIWQEYEDSETLESHYVHDIDKVELLLQMVEYEKRGERKVDLGEFAYVAKKMVLDETKQWAAELLREREQFWHGKGHVHGELGAEGGVNPDHAHQQEEYYSKYK